MKSIFKYPLEQDVFLEKNAQLTCLYGIMHIQLDDYPPYNYTLFDIFKTNINKNLRCCHGYTNYAGNVYKNYMGIKKILGKCFIQIFFKHKLSLPIPGRLYVIIVINILYQVIYLTMEEMFMKKNILVFQVHFSKNPLEL